MSKQACEFPHNTLAWIMHHLSQIVGKEVYMTKKQLLHKIAMLESVNDQLSAEVVYVDHLMKMIGFSEGIQTVKATAQEIIEKGYDLDADTLES
jgi:hypothetical protein